MKDKCKDCYFSDNGDCTCSGVKMCVSNRDERRRRMKCERCGSKNISLQSIRILRDTQTERYIYPVCNDCIRDIVKFIELPPDFNCHGFNLKSYEQSKECDTRYNRGYAKEKKNE